MGQVTTSKQRTPRPLASPSDKIGAKASKPSGARMHQASRWRHGPGARGQTKVPGRPRACPGSATGTEHPRRRLRARKRPRPRPAAGRAPAPPRLHGNERPRPGSPSAARQASRQAQDARPAPLARPPLLPLRRAPAGPEPLLAPTAPGRGSSQARKGRIKGPVHLLLQM